MRRWISVDLLTSQTISQMQADRPLKTLLLFSRISQHLEANKF
jgi:hypothetical protein